MLMKLRENRKQGEKGVTRLIRVVVKQNVNGVNMGSVPIAGRVAEQDILCTAVRETRTGRWRETRGPSDQNSKSSL